MRNWHYYSAFRIPSKGELKIIRIDNDFPKRHEETIEENCLEIYVPECAHDALMVYPLGTKRFI